MRGGVVQEKCYFVKRELRGFCLLCGDRAEGGKHCKVDCTGVVEESADDLLNKRFVGLIEKGRVVVVGRVLFGGTIRWLYMQVVLILWFPLRFVLEARDGSFGIIKHG